MKNKISLSLLIAALCFLTYSCKDKYTANYMANVPVYMDFDTFRSQTFQMENAQSMKTPGKIWIKDQYLFVNELLKGIHVFDNSNPSDPINLGFIEIFANTDMAVKGNLLYADNYNDLLTFDISDIMNPSLVCRANNVFNFQAANNLPGYDQEYSAAGVDWSKGVITSWNQEEVTEEIGGVYLWDNNSFLIDAAFESTTAAGGISSVSVGGSMARFTIQDEHLHVLEQRELTTYDISGDCPSETNTVAIWRIGETIFRSGDHLFIGTTTGMLIYDASNPSQPEFVSDYPHVNSCDPVVVQGNKAYVTLRTGTRCAGDINELVIVDISNLEFPQEIATYDMTNPHGLGVDGNTLFLCDGSAGLKVYDAADPYGLGSNLISEFSDIQTYDVIPLGGRLLMTSAQGIFQYDYSDINNITQLSLIPVE